MPEVVLSNVSKVYPRNISAVSNLNLEVKDKEFLLILGPAGSGKTTVLRMIAGLEKPSSGVITSNGRVINDIPPKDRDVAMIFHDPSLYQHMSVYNNMAFGLKMRRMPADVIDKRVKNTADQLGIRDILKRKPLDLTLEQSIRAALGRALVKKPSLILCDDPLAKLNSKLRARLFTDIAGIHKGSDLTIIYSAEDPAEATSISNRIAVMDNGSLKKTADQTTLNETQ